MSASYEYIPLSDVEKRQDQTSGDLISSPILFDLLNTMPEQEYLEILDVMPASQGMIDLFADRHCKIYLPGCHLGLCDITTEKYETENKILHALSRNVGLYKKQKASLNIIFIWDLLNYMDESVIKIFVSYLLNHVNNKTRLHLYIHTRQNMPATPANYHLMDNDKIFINKKSQDLISSPLYFRNSLEKLLNPYKVKRSMLLSGGIQEYILEI